MAETPENSTGSGAVTRRQALGVGGAVAAGLAATQLGAESAMAAEGSRGSVPMRTISLAQADRMIRAAVRFVREQGLPPMFILVVDACGDEKASRRMDGNAPASVSLVPPKAHTARSFGASTADLAERTTDPARIASFIAAGFSLLGGGRPIIVDGELIGAIGVGGGRPDQDDQVAAAALDAL